MDPQKSYTISEAAKKLEGYCAYQERCHKEVILKLRSMQMIPTAIDQIVAGLIKENYLNEERFARSFARGKFNIKKWGKNRIVNELKRREISKYNISSALEEIEGFAYETALDVLAKKRALALRDTNLQKRKKKLADYLLYRGWEPQLVYGKVNELLGNGQ